MHEKKGTHRASGLPLQEEELAFLTSRPFIGPLVGGFPLLGWFFRKLLGNKNIRGSRNRALSGQFRPAPLRNAKAYLGVPGP